MNKEAGLKGVDETKKEVDREVTRAVYVGVKSRGGTNSVAGGGEQH